MKAFQDQLKTLEGADTQVLGVSMDSPFANKAWAQQIGVTFPLLSDMGGDTSSEYGVYNPTPTYKAARRVTYLIDKDGKVVEMQKDRDAIDPTSVVTSCERRRMKS
jgi:peroxiredoxin (alkyl hydroperoxide reductase subunit C)